MRELNQPTDQMPNDFLPWAILSTIFCCLPFGVVAIIRSTQVNSYWSRGLHKEAYEAAASARRWTWWSVGIALAGWVIYFVIVVAIAGAAISLGGC